MSLSTTLLTGINQHGYLQEKGIFLAALIFVYRKHNLYKVVVIGC